MTTQEINELTGDSLLYIRNKIKTGEWKGKYMAGKQSEYKVYRYWFYANVLFWQEWRIKEYHNSAKGRFWLSYDPYASKRRKKEPAQTGSSIIN